MRLADLGSQETSVYVRVASANQRKTKNGTPIINLRLADASGQLPATLFNDHLHFEDAAKLKAGDVVAIRARRGSYQGKPELEIYKLRTLDERDDGRWDPDEVFGLGMAPVRDLTCKHLVMDIETAPIVDENGLPSSLAEEVNRVANDKDWPVDKVLALNPLFSRVVSIAVGNADTSGGTVLFAPEESDLESLKGEAPEWVRVLPEREMLAGFWALAGQAETVITFNGRSFDLPFMRTRSAILDVAVTTDLLSQPPYQHAPHLDLYVILASGSWGARPTNLDAACYAFGIESPKGAMDGSMVGQAFRDKRYLEIAKYNLTDIDATRELYRRLKGPVLDHLS